MTEDGGPWGREPQEPAPPPRPAAGRLGLWLCLWAALGGFVLALARAFPEAVRTPGDWASVAYSAGLVVLVSAGIFRAGRIAGPRHLRYAAIWAAIIAALALGFAYRSELSGVGRRLQLAFSVGDPVVVGEHELAIPQNEDGTFVVVAKVNGQRVRFMVDTGASETVLGPDDARRIGVDMAGLRYGFEAETANGTGYGAPFVADRFEVGPIALSGFGVIVNRAPMSASLLGMSFLRRLDSYRVEGGQLILRWRDGA
jgi:aspartyl protease family protein